MRKLLELDSKNYPETDDVIDRIAVRAIILEPPYLYMIKSDQFGEYKFPGGGQEPGESLIDTLKREVLEEAGMIISDDIKPYGYVIEKRKSTLQQNHIFYMKSYYYICHIEKQGLKQTLDDYEASYGYRVEKVDIKDAIKQNENILKSCPDEIPWTSREYKVLKLIKDELC